VSDGLRRERKATSLEDRGKEARRLGAHQGAFAPFSTSTYITPPKPAPAPALTPVIKYDPSKSFLRSRRSQVPDGVSSTSYKADDVPNTNIQHPKPAMHYDPLKSFLRSHRSQLPDSQPTTSIKTFEARTTVIQPPKSAPAWTPASVPAPKIPAPIPRRPISETPRRRGPEAIGQNRDGHDKRQRKSKAPPKSRTCQQCGAIVTFVDEPHRHCPCCGSIAGPHNFAGWRKLVQRYVLYEAPPLPTNKYKALKARKPIPYVFRHEN
jgi:hypothetical protein